MATTVLLVMDAVGIETLQYLLDRYPGKVELPNLARMGLGKILGPKYQERLGSPDGRSFALPILQASTDADSVIGHREMCGSIDLRTFPLFYDGFPPEYVKALEQATGHQYFFNQMAGGMKAIEDNAAEHERTGKLILYASKCDPLMQIAMNEAVVPVPEQHRIVETAFKLAWEMGVRVTRVIARSYVNIPGDGFKRTANRHDVVLPLGHRTLIEVLREKGVRTVSVGKPSDMLHVPFDETIKITDPNALVPELRDKYAHAEKADTNPLTGQGLLNALDEASANGKDNFIFTNFVDTDSLWGHTRDIEGSLRCVSMIDRMLPLFEAKLKKGDLLMITADHGMEHRPDTAEGAGYGYHHREHTPLLVERVGYGADLGGLKPGQTPGMTQIGDLVAQMYDCHDEYHQVIHHIET